MVDGRRLVEGGPRGTRIDVSLMERLPQEVCLLEEEWLAR